MIWCLKRAVLLLSAGGGDGMKSTALVSSIQPDEIPFEIAAVGLICRFVYPFSVSCTDSCYPLTGADLETAFAAPV